MDDLISRQGAEKVLDSHRYEYENKHLNDYEQGWNDVIDYAVDEWLDEQSPAQPDRTAQERYEDLCEYFKDCTDKGMGILGDRKEFKAWLERLHWHVVRCDELGRELEKLQSTQPDYKTDHGFVWLCPKCGLPVHSDFEKCVRCGYER